MKDEICCEFVAEWGLLSIYESGAYGVSNPKIHSSCSDFVLTFRAQALFC